MTLQAELGGEAYVRQVLEELQSRRPDWIFAEVSGGHDSVAMLHAVAHQDIVDIDAIVHFNTGIGAEHTRQYARRQAARLGIPFIEGIQPDPDRRYGPQVLENGFPGANPIAHEIHRRQLKSDVEDHIVKSFEGDIYVLTGANRHESQRRKITVSKEGFQESDRRDVTYVGPVADLLGTELNAILARYDVDRNEFADLLDSSGECLCSAFGSFWDLGILWEYGCYELVWAICQLMTLADLYWQSYREDEGKAPYPRQYLVWGHGGVGDGALSKMVNGSLDDPANYRDGDDLDERAQQAIDDDQQLDLSNKCSSCEQRPVATDGGD